MSYNDANHVPSYHAIHIRDFFQFAPSEKWTPFFRGQHILNSSLKPIGYDKEQAKVLTITGYAT